MSEENKRDLDEMCSILKELDSEDLALIKGGAMVLRAKRDMEAHENPPIAKTNN